MKGYDPELGQYVDLPEREPAAVRPQPRPCLCVLDAGGEEEGIEGRVCGQPSTYHAKDNDAAYGHVCGDCWEALPEPEQELYAFVGLDGEARS